MLRLKMALDGNSDNDKRAQRNASEKKRRDDMAEAFDNLRDEIPALAGRKVSKAVILNLSMEFIKKAEKALSDKEKKLQDLRKRQELYQKQILILEQIRASRASAVASSSKPEMLISEEVPMAIDDSISESLNSSCSEETENVKAGHPSKP